MHAPVAYAERGMSNPSPARTVAVRNLDVASKPIDSVAGCPRPATESIGFEATSRFRTATVRAGDGFDIPRSA